MQVVSRARRVALRSPRGGQKIDRHDNPKGLKPPSEEMREETFATVIRRTQRRFNENGNLKAPKSRMNDFTVHRAAIQSHSDVAPRRQIAEAPRPAKSAPGISAQKSNGLSPVACEAKPTSMPASTLPNSPKEAERVAKEAVSAFEAANDALPARLAEIDHPPGRPTSPVHEQIRENKKREAEQDVRCLRLLAEAAAVNLRAIQEHMGGSLVPAEQLLHRTTDLGIAEHASSRSTDALNDSIVALRELMKSIGDNLGEPDRHATQVAQEALADAKRAADAERAAWQAAEASAKDPVIRDRCRNWIISAQSTISTLDSLKKSLEN